MYGEKVLIAQTINSLVIRAFTCSMEVGMLKVRLDSVGSSAQPGKCTFISSSNVSIGDAVQLPSGFLRNEGFECSFDRTLLSLAESLMFSMD